MVRTMALALGTVGVACLVARITLGETWAGPARRRPGRRSRVFGPHVAAQTVDTSPGPPRQLSSGTAPGAARRHPVKEQQAMPQERESATLSDYTAIIARRWRVVVATVLVFMVLGALAAFKGGTTYTSNASLVIRPILSDPFGRTGIEDVGADTQAKVLDSTVVAERGRQAAQARHATRRTSSTGWWSRTPLGTLILNIAFTATHARARPGRRAGVRAGVPRLPPQRRRGHQAAHARAGRRRSATR